MGKNWGNNFYKSNKGSVTLFVLIAMLFFLGLAFSSYTAVSNKLQAQNKEIYEIKSSYSQNTSQNDLEQLYQEQVEKSK